MFQHILVPLDGSSRAEQALPVAAQVARFTGGSLLLVQVVSPPPDYTGGWFPVPLLNQQAIDAEIASATAYLQALASSPGLAGIEIRTEVLFGLPMQHLTAFAESPGVDLVVLCSHGRTGFTRWVLGSVARSMVHQCTVPILVLRQQEAPSPLASRAAPGPIRTLVPLDGSPLAETALRPAAHLTAALAAAGQGALHLAQVVKVFLATAEEGFGSSLNDEALQRARAYLSQVDERLSPEANTLQISLTHSVEMASDVASALLAQAEYGKNGNAEEETEKSGACDLIALSTHGRGGLERWVMGSVTERILNATKLPMLIVRPPKEA